MTVSITQWLTGSVIPLYTGAEVTVTVVADGPGSVQFTSTGAVVLPVPSYKVDLTPVTIAGQQRYWASVSGVKIPVGTADGSSTTLKATPYDISDVAGNPLSQTLTFNVFTDDSGKMILTNGGFIATPTKKDVDGQYWSVAMQAHKSVGNTGVTGAMVMYHFQPSSGIEVYDAAGGLQHPIGEFYFIQTDGTNAGKAAVRVVTLDAVANQEVSCFATMNGMDESKLTQCIFGNNEDSHESGLWVPPSVTLDGDGTLHIPSYGDTFHVDISVNGEDDASYKRYVVMNNQTAFEYPHTSDGYIEVNYSALDQTPNNDNKFTYVRMTPEGNVKTSPQLSFTVTGSRANLPDPQAPNRTQLQLMVVPDPGTGRIISLNTLDQYKRLRVQILQQEFDAGLLPGYQAGQGSLSAEFKFYMNGYLSDGTDRPGQVYSSVGQSWAFITPTPQLTWNSGDQKLKWSSQFVDMQYGTALGWGSIPGTLDMKKVGFEFKISDGTTTWYSYYSASSSWYYISTGNW